MLVSSVIVPHPPVMVPSVGGKEGLKPIEKTISSMLQVAQQIGEIKPDIVVVLSPHGPVYHDRISIRIPDNGILEGDFSEFGSEEGLSLEPDNEFADKILDDCVSAGLKMIVPEENQLDHGVLVPMYYIDKVLSEYKIVSANISYGSYKSHYDFGKVLRKAFDETNKKVLFVASADLSHVLEEDGPYGYNKVGEEFDDMLIKLIEEGNTEAILEMDPFWVDQAKECGLRSVCAALGMADRYEVLSYEGPYGVGYMVAVSV